MNTPEILWRPGVSDGPPRIVKPARTRAATPPAVPTPRVPRAPQWDCTLALWADPYRYIGRTCDRLGTDGVETRLLLQRSYLLRGADAARLFYDPALFQRQGAAPEPLRATLFGKGTVQSLDGAAHLHRKALFASLTGPQDVARIVALAREGWRAAIPAWRAQGPVSLYRALQPVLTEAVCRWAGVPLPSAEIGRRSAQLTALFDSAMAGPLAHLRSRVARWQAEVWLARWIALVRTQRGDADPRDAGAAVAWHRQPNGDLLPARVAAAELLNLLRPTVAVSLYLVFVAHALHRHPQAREQLLGEGAGSTAARDFAQEVRRHYPFFPAVVARVRRDFEWQGLPLVAGRRAVLDLYGTNHDPRLWADPHRFMPERFRGRTVDPFEFVPQGGGSVSRDHRCPGEDLAAQLMHMAIPMLLHEMPHSTPPQDFSLRMDRLPALPRDGFVVRVH